MRQARIKWYSALSHLVFARKHNVMPTQLIFVLHRKYACTVTCSHVRSSRMRMDANTNSRASMSLVSGVHSNHNFTEINI